MQSVQTNQILPVLCNSVSYLKKKKQNNFYQLMEHYQSNKYWSTKN